MLPAQWVLEVVEGEGRVGGPRPDALLNITAPDGTTGSVVVETKARVSARQAAAVSSRFSEIPSESGLLLTRYVSRMGQTRLREGGVSYLDRTGNAWIRLARPAVFIERQGAASDPDPPRRGVQSLKGAKAARIVRGLCDWRSPVGVRELARRTGADASYVTRVLSLLEDDDIVVRGSNGEVAEVRWRDLLIRWADDYSLTGSNRASTFLAPRGLSLVREQLSALSSPYAITGSFAVPPEAEVAPGRILSCYVSGIETAAKELEVRPTEAGANVILLEPFDDVVFERTRSQDGSRLVAMSQCAADLMTGSGREPAQADALLTWMAENEDAWRS